MRSTLRPLGLALALAGSARADFDPISLTPGSFNHDVVVESTAPPPAGRATRASMDAGTNNTGNSWYEVGYNIGNPTTGIPAAGSTFTHETFADHQYAMAPSFSAPNALLIAPGQVTAGSFAFSAPAACGNLSVLASGGNGGCTVNYTIRYADATTQAGTLAIGDWFNGANPAWTTRGRVNVGNFGFGNVNETNPRLYGYDIALNNTASGVTGIDISLASGSGRIAIFAISGAPAAGGNWSPIAVTGYNYDMIVEAGAPQPGALRTATTASMDGGTNNTGATWFERGYDPFNPAVGLPTAGSTITSLSLTDHHYMMPASYAANNVAMVDSNSPIANLTLANPTAYSALSFLSATANGTVTNQCVMQYADGTAETNTFLSRDWFNNSPVAFNAQGRINLNDRTFNNINNNNPRLYEAQFVLGNTSSPLTNVVLIWVGGSATSRAVVFAVSGTAGAVPPIFSSHPQSTGTFEGSNAVFSATLLGGSEPLTFRWQKGTNGVFVDLVDGGNISGSGTTNLTISSVAFTDVAEYRLAVFNEAGSAESLAAPLNVLSALPDVTSPGDPIETFGGTTPAAEGAAQLIDDAAQKFLNYGSGPNAQQPPFVGPVGVVITPSKGFTRVTGLRIYTANDAAERDPASYILEGSRDGGATYSLISSNALSLPGGRNGGGTTPINPVSQFLQQVMFANPDAYSTYRLTFPNVKNPTVANSAQVGEVELLGTTLPLLSIRRDVGGAITVTSSAAGMLQTTTEIKENTQWDDYGPVGVGEPQYFEPTETRYFRLLVQ